SGSDVWAVVSDPFAFESVIVSWLPRSLRLSFSDGLQGNRLRWLFLTVPESVENTVAVQSMIRVRTEIVALRLDELACHRCLAQGIEVVDGRRHTRRWPPPPPRGDVRASRAVDRLVRELCDARIDKEVGQLWILRVGAHDFG